MEDHLALRFSETGAEAACQHQTDPWGHVGSFPPGPEAPVTLGYLMEAHGCEG